MHPVVTPYFHAATHSYAYVVAEPGGRAAVVVDPVLDYDAGTARTGTLFADALLAQVRGRKLELAWVLETHAHADHLSAAGYLRAQTGARLGAGAGIAAVQRRFAPLFALEQDACARAFDALFEDGARIPLGALEIAVTATPGHTPDGVAYRIGDAVFLGDTLFQPDVGTARCDFPGGDAATLHRSIGRLLELPGATRLFHGHDYPPEGREPRAESSVAVQRAGNVHLAGGREQDYVALRTARDRTLPPPALMLPALQWNLRGGRPPPARANGIAYLELPLDAL